LTRYRVNLKMAKQFADQGGAASSNPSWLRRWLTSKMMRRLADTELRARRRKKTELRRQKSGAVHRIEYFHQVGDPYSHLAAQVLQPLIDTYEVEVSCHLVAGASGKNSPEPALLQEYARYDCTLVAPHYDLEFNVETTAPSEQGAALATRILAASDQLGFPQLAVTVGQALWTDDMHSLAELAERFGCSDAAEAEQRVVRGTARRARLGHYSGAMFYYGGEWYWGG